MKKYSFLVYHKEYIDFLKGIQELGVLHVIEKGSVDIADEELREKYLQVNELGNAIKLLSKIELDEQAEVRNGDGLSVLKELQKLQSDSESYHQRLAQLSKEKSVLEPWGNFSWETLAKLKNAGYYFDFFMTSARTFDETWKEQFDIEIINDAGGTIYFVVIRKESTTTDIDSELVKLPEISLAKANSSIDEIEAILEKTEEIYKKFASEYLTLLEDTKEKISRELEFEKVVLTTPHEAENRLRVLEGWVPKDVEEDVNTFLDKSGVYFEAFKPEPGEEPPPIKLKNNAFSRLFESIGELYTFPDYGEIDLTPFFAPFYMLFFGFCLGDAGYGLLITIGTIIGIFKVQNKFKPLMKLGMYLGISTTIMGVISGTMFGIFLTDQTWPWIQKYKAIMLNSDNMMYLALGLGYVQVVFAMFLKAANKARMYGFKHSISQFGWIIIVLLTLPVYALGNFDVIPAGIASKIALITLIAGGIPALFYNTPGKNPLLNLGVGVWDTYQTASGLLGDVLSYIRLFALGISSAILGNVFNTLATDLSPEKGVAKVIVMILILAFGHGLNFFMAALGSFVHPLRLTFVEFYKNAGFMGGGKKYNPLKN